MTTKYLNMSSEISDHFHSTFHVWKPHMVDCAPRASTKTTKNALKIVRKMMVEPNMETIVFRQTYKDHKTSTFRALISAFNRCGVNLIPGVHYTRSKNGSTWIRTPDEYGGSYIHFVGLSDIESNKGFEPSSIDKFIGIGWYFEVTQFTGKTQGPMYDLANLTASFARGKAPFYYSIYEWNPSPNKSHWTYDLLNDMRKREEMGNAIIIEGTYLDIPEVKRKKWLGNLLTELEILKKTDYDLYSHIYLGRLYNNEGSIYKNWDYNRHVVDLSNNRSPGMVHIIGVDYGNVDATSFQFGIINTGFAGLRVVKEYYHKNGKSLGKKVVNHYADDLIEFIRECYDMVKQPIIVYIDKSAGDFYNIAKQLAATKLRGMCQFKKTPSGKDYEIINRISVMNLMLGADWLQIDKSCKYLQKAIDLAEYDKNSKRVDNTSTHYNDALDAFEYIWLAYIVKIRQLVLAGVKYRC